MNPKILVADDDPIFRLMLKKSLATTTSTVTIASTGTEAWGWIQSLTDPLLAILDWHMPGIDGLELCQRIRELPPNRLTYVILLTGRSDKESIIRGLTSGAHDYITKPFDHQELHARIQVGLRMLHLQETLARRVQELEVALSKVNQLQRLLPICCYCKSIRSDTDYWQQVEHYLADNASMRFSHGICPSCYSSVVEPQLAAFREQHTKSNEDQAKK